MELSLSLSLSLFISLSLSFNQASIDKYHDVKHKY